MSELVVLVLLWVCAAGTAGLVGYLAVECWREYRRLTRTHTRPVMGRPNIRRMR